MENFKGLKVWSKAHDLTLTIYRVTRTFPKDEVYGLTSQLRRACSSIGANLAEGCGRRSDPEMKRFVQIARGSASEVEYHLLLARDLNFITHEELEVLETRILEVQRMLTSLSQSLQRSVSAKS